MKLENIVIYCGSHFGAELSYASFAGELAEAIAKSGRTIPSGGGTVTSWASSLPQPWQQAAKSSASFPKSSS